MNPQSNIKPLLGVGVIIIVALAAIEHFRQTSTEITIDPNQVLTVSQIGSNPDRFQGRIKLKGTVSEVFTEKSLFALSELSPNKTLERKTDEKERNCNTNRKKGCCGTPRIPIKYEGPLPKLQANVLVEGKIVNNEDGKKYFQAEKITNL